MSSSNSMRFCAPAVFPMAPFRNDCQSLHGRMILPAAASISYAGCGSTWPDRVVPALVMRPLPFRSCPNFPAVRPSSSRLWVSAGVPASRRPRMIRVVFTGMVNC